MAQKRRVPFFELRKQYGQLSQQIQAKVTQVLESGWYILGKESEKFETEFAGFLDCKHCIGLNSGTDALELALRCLGVGEGDEVILPSHTFIATAMAVTKVGAKPVFVDIDEHYQMDIDQAEKMINKKTKAIIVVHLYGLSGNVKRLKSITKSHKIFLVEDACQAHGASFEGKKLGTFGDFGCFSFYPTKNLGAYGDAGALVTDSPKLAEKARLHRNYGQIVKYKHEFVGSNSRLDEIQAGILSTKLKFLPQWNKKRRMLAREYDLLLSDISQIVLPPIADGLDPVYHQYVIRAQQRDSLQKYLFQAGIDTLIHYPIPIHKQKAYRHYNRQKLPKTESAVKEILSLPIYPEMSPDDVKYVAKTIREFYA